MSDKTQIEWTDATWNPVTGCTKVSQGCKHCYAERDWSRLAANPATRYHGRAFTDVRCHEDVLTLPLRWNKPRRVFVNSMSDLFHQDVPDVFIRAVFGVMALTPHHTYQVLTKRPDRMLAWLRQFGTSPTPLVYRHGDPGFYHIARNFPDGYPATSWPLPNVWLGVSVEDQATADERIPLLLDTPAAVRWISAEPLLGPIDLCAIKIAETCASECCGNRRYDALSGFTYCGEAPAEDAEPMTRLDWVVVGGESGPHARPMHPDWVRILRDQCAVAGVPFLFKQWGEWAPNCLCDTKHAHPETPRPQPGLPGCMFRCGKKNAGRLLDGVEHNEYPEDKP